MASASALFTLAMAGTAWGAFQQLPPGDQVNNDAAAGIDPARAVSTEEPNADVTGGSLAGGVQVPWAVFRQTTSGHDQVFSRSFANGKWTTRGNGTQFGGGGARPFSGSLNFRQDQDGEAPSIDFAGAGRTVPWATWYEDNPTFGGHTQIFASRFDNPSNTWIFSGQDRGSGIPSLNIHTGEDAENPVVAGGSLVDPTKPGPWITWQETDGGANHQIFVSKPIGPGTAACPAGTKPAGGAPIGGFCFQQTGVERVNGNADPSLNVDPVRDGIEPDIAFTGTNDSVPWVVWYETGDGTVGNDNEQVFAAKGVAPAGAAGTVDGNLQWVAVGGHGGSGVLDTSGTHHAGPCLTDLAHEQGCTLNADPTADAEDPRVASGTMTAGNATVPWVAWDEQSGGHDRIFVSRLVNGTFQLANGGRPLPTLVGGIDATRPDITFSGNTPYVSWHEGSSVVYGHFTTPDSFVIDNGAVGTNVPADLRAPISSGCTANPFNADGANCQAGAAGTPFFLFTDGNTPKLLADAYQTDAPLTGAPSSIGTTAATVTASVNPQGGPVKVHFDFGTTTAYGSSTADQRLAPANAATAFSGALSGLPAATTIHYRAVAVTDFGSVVGADHTLTTAAIPPSPPTGGGSGGNGGGGHSAPHLSVSLARTTIHALLRSHKLKLTLKVDELTTVRLDASVASHSIGRATVRAAGTRSVSVSLTKAGLKRLRHLHRATIRVAAAASDGASGHASLRVKR